MGATHTRGHLGRAAGMHDAAHLWERSGSTWNMALPAGAAGSGAPAGRSSATSGLHPRQPAEAVRCRRLWRSRPRCGSGTRWRPAKPVHHSVRLPRGNVRPRCGRARGARDRTPPPSGPAGPQNYEALRASATAAPAEHVGTVSADAWGRSGLRRFHRLRGVILAEAGSSPSRGPGRSRAWWDRSYQSSLLPPSRYVPVRRKLRGSPHASQPVRQSLPSVGYVSALRRHETADRALKAATS